MAIRHHSPSSNHRSILEEAPSTLSIHFHCDPRETHVPDPIPHHLLGIGINGHNHPNPSLYKPIPSANSVLPSSSHITNFLHSDMSQTFTNSADWSEFLHSTPPSSVFSDHIHSASAIPAPTTDPNPNHFSFNSAPPPSSNIPASNRTIRVTKPARKRSRASRRTPTTLLSTDTSNFRAMVQQFTGGPSALGFQIGATVDHQHPRRAADQPLHSSGAEFTSSSMFATPSSGYDFHSHHTLPPQQAAYGSGAMEHSRLMVATSSAASLPNHSYSFLY